MFKDKFNLGGLGNLAGLIKNAGKIQEVMKEAQDKLAKIEVTGEAGAGAVTIKMNAQNYVKEVCIDDTLLKEEKIILQELIAAAINDAAQKIEKEKEQLMGANMFGGLLPDNEK